MSGTRTLCCHVHTSTRASAIFCLMLNLFVALDMAVGVIKEKDPLIVSYSVSYSEIKHSQTSCIFEITSNFLTVALMSLSSVLVLLAHCKGPLCVLPFVLFMFLDVGMTLLSLFDARFGLPGTPTYDDALRFASNLKGGATLEGPELNRVTLIFGVFVVMFIMLKLYMLQVSMRYFYLLKEESGTANSKAKTCVKVNLPSYDEALKMKPDVMPPAYQEP